MLFSGCVREFDLLQQSGRDSDVMAAPWSPQPEVSAAFRVRCRRSPLRRSAGGTVEVAYAATAACQFRFVFSLPGRFGRSFPTQNLGLLDGHTPEQTRFVLGLTSRRMEVQ